MINVGISGAAGRMGKSIINVVKKDNNLKISLLLEKKGHPEVGIELEGVKITDDLEKEVEKIDVFIDFTLPEATLENLKILKKYKKPVVIGTTGFNKEELKNIEETSKIIPIVLASNFSVGVNVLWKIVRDITKILKEDYDIDIVESHHRYKKDAPSGTAVTIGKIIAEEKGVNYEDKVIFGREGRDNVRDRDEIGIFAVRGGGVVGEHTVIYASDGDKLEIKHTAFSRETFASGAVKAAKFIINKSPRLYSFSEVLGI